MDFIQWFRGKPGPGEKGGPVWPDVFLTALRFPCEETRDEGEDRVILGRILPDGTYEGFEDHLACAYARVPSPPKLQPTPEEIERYESEYGPFPETDDGEP